MKIVKKIFNEFNFFIILAISWSFYFLNSTLKLEEGPESVLLIKPLFYFFAGISIFIIVESIVKNLNTTSQLIERKKIYFLITVLLFFCGLNLFGYLISTFFFYIILSYLLGFRSKFILIPPFLALIIVYFFFYKLLKIPLPL
jgi:putative tricarboxylic transport membrane protein